MKFASIKGIILTTSVVIAVLLSIHVGHKAFYTSFRKVFCKSSLSDNKPAGELIARRKIIQPVFLKKSIENKVCIAILFATYRRTCKGIIRMSLIQDNKKYFIRFDTSELKDNSCKTFCFDNVDLKSGNAEIEILSIEGKRGKSPTVWLTRDIPYGPAVIDNKQGNRGLTFSIFSPMLKPLYYEFNYWKIAFWFWFSSFIVGEIILMWFLSIIFSKESLKD